jgi:hypothetical protein
MFRNASSIPSAKVASCTNGFSKLNSQAHRYLCLRFKPYLAMGPPRPVARGKVRRCIRADARPIAGRYILTPEVFEFLQVTELNPNRERYELTDALAGVAQTHFLCAAVAGAYQQLRLDESCKGLLGFAKPLQAEWTLTAESAAMRSSCPLGGWRCSDSCSDTPV